MVKSIETLAADGTTNGSVLTIWNERDDDWQPGQIYITKILPGCSKGPHLHRIRHGRFVCLAGTVKIRLRHPNGVYEDKYRGAEFACGMVEVPTGTVAKLTNIGTEVAIVANLPSPGWTPFQNDECPVEGWQD